MSLLEQKDGGGSVDGFKELCDGGNQRGYDQEYGCGTMSTLAEL